MKTIELSTEQQIVVDAIMEWRDRNPSGDAQYLTLGGYAGTGKTTVISQLAGIWKNVAFVAYCGKAAHVLRMKGVDAQTIHKLIYVPAKNAARGFHFRKRRTLDGVETIVVDEASMIDHVTCADLLSFKVPVLFVGDHGQLPPIGTSAGLMVNPKLRLEQIHRQGQKNPILRAAAAFREGRNVPQWQDPKGRLSILSSSEFERMISPDLQIICGINKTRHAVNMRVRETMGCRNRQVVPGEKLICLRNNASWNVFNGQQVTVLDIAREGRRIIELEVETDDERSLILPCLRDQFGCGPIKDFRSNEIALMDYGYALTAHKAQGSEWNSVLVLEEIASNWDVRRWRYTVASRARDRLVYCR